MKIRNGYVSNSSSSSFLIIGRKIDYNDIKDEDLIYVEGKELCDGKDIFLDGFSYFTGREMRILRIMLRRAANVTVTLLGDASDSELFQHNLLLLHVPFFNLLY